MASKNKVDPKLDILRDRAASKIIWGEDRESVYSFLLSNGVSPEMADEFLDAANRERTAMIRQRSMIGLGFGLAGALVCGGILAFVIASPDIRFSFLGYVTGALPLGLGFAGSVIFALKNIRSLLTGRKMGAAMDD